MTGKIAAPQRKGKLSRLIGIACTGPAVLRRALSMKKPATLVMKWLGYILVEAGCAACAGIKIFNSAEGLPAGQGAGPGNSPFQSANIPTIPNHSSRLRRDITKKTIGTTGDQARADLVNCENYGDAMSDGSRCPLERQRAGAAGCVLRHGDCNRRLRRARAVQRDLSGRHAASCIGWRAAAGKRNVSCEAVDGPQCKRVGSRMPMRDCSRRSGRRLGHLPAVTTMFTVWDSVLRDAAICAGESAFSSRFK